MFSFSSFTDPALAAREPTNLDMQLVSPKSAASCSEYMVDTRREGLREADTPRC